MSGFDKKQTAASPDDIDQKMKMLSVMEKVAKATGQPAPGAAPGGAAADVNSMQSVEEIKDDLGVTSDQYAMLRQAMASRRRSCWTGGSRARHAASTPCAA